MLNGLLLRLVSDSLINEAALFINSYICTCLKSNTEMASSPLKETEVISPRFLRHINLKFKGKTHSQVWNKLNRNILVQILIF